MIEYEDPFPDEPAFEEFQEMKPDVDEVIENSGLSDRDSWYNTAPFVAARIIIRAACEYDGFRDEFMESDELGKGHRLRDYDADEHEKLNSMSLSALQGGHAEQIAEAWIKNHE